MSREQLYLISYDIADPQRLNRVARRLQRHACRVQYSVFTGQFTPRQLGRLLVELSGLIEPNEDDIRCYPLPIGGDVALLGRQLFANDVLLIRNGRRPLCIADTGAGEARYRLLPPLKDTAGEFPA